METIRIFEVRDYDLAATLTSGQAFRWKQCGADWIGVVAGKWVRIRQEGSFEIESGIDVLSESPSAQNSPSMRAPRPHRIDSIGEISPPSPRPSPPGRGGIIARPARTSTSSGLVSSTASAELTRQNAVASHNCNEGNCIVTGQKSGGSRLVVETAEPVSNWDWLEDYLQVRVKLDQVLSTFPDDEPMRTSVAACRGLRLLRQDPWECLASFILSSTKQIVQIQQIIGLLCERFGEPLVVPSGHVPVFAFPSAETLAKVNEAELRACKMGFRAPYLRATAQMIVSGQFDPVKLRLFDASEARAELMKLPGVGGKIADCVLLFAGGFQSAFPVDVWVLKALRQLYFPRRRPSAQRLKRFTASHFGPYAGYAQQYLFHYMRTIRNHEGRRTKEGRRPEVKNVNALQSCMRG